MILKYMTKPERVEVLKIDCDDPEIIAKVVKLCRGDVREAVLNIGHNEIIGKYLEGVTGGFILNGTFLIRYWDGEIVNETLSGLTNCFTLEAEEMNRSDQ